jgi:addiction module HigA family antidote
MAKATLTPGAAVKKQLDQYNLNIAQLAEGLKISHSAASVLLKDQVRITVPMAQRLSRFFGKTPEYWLSLQNAYELAALSADKKNTAILKSITKAVKVPAKAPAKKAAVVKKAKAPAKAAKPARKPRAKKRY